MCVPPAVWASWPRAETLGCLSSSGVYGNPPMRSHCPHPRRQNQCWSTGCFLQCGHLLGWPKSSFEKPKCSFLGQRFQGWISHRPENLLWKETDHLALSTFTLFLESDDWWLLSDEFRNEDVISLTELASAFYSYKYGAFANPTLMSWVRTLIFLPVSVNEASSVASWDQLLKGLLTGSLLSHHIPAGMRDTLALGCSDWQFPPISRSGSSYCYKCLRAACNFNKSLYSGSPLGSNLPTWESESIDKHCDCSYREKSWRLQSPFTEARENRVPLAPVGGQGVGAWVVTHAWQFRWGDFLLQNMIF